MLITSIVIKYSIENKYHPISRISDPIATNNLWIIFFLGNNDLPEDYEPPVDEENKHYKVLGDRLQDFIFPPLSTIRTINNVSLFRETFNIGGFYSVNISGIIFLIASQILSSPNSILGLEIFGEA